MTITLTLYPYRDMISTLLKAIKKNLKIILIVSNLLVYGFISFSLFSIFTSCQISNSRCIEVKSTSYILDQINKTQDSLAANNRTITNVILYFDDKQDFDTAEESIAFNRKAVNLFERIGVNTNYYTETYISGVSPVVVTWLATEQLNLLKYEVGKLVNIVTENTPEALQLKMRQTMVLDPIDFHIKEFEKYKYEREVYLDYMPRLDPYSSNLTLDMKEYERRAKILAKELDIHTDRIKTSPGNDSTVSLKLKKGELEKLKFASNIRWVRANFEVLLKVTHRNSKQYL